MAYALLSAILRPCARSRRRRRPVHDEHRPPVADDVESARKAAVLPIGAHTPSYGPRFSFSSKYFTIQSMRADLLLRIVSIVAFLQFVGHGTLFVRARPTHG